MSKYITGIKWESLHESLRRKVIATFIDVSFDGDFVEELLAAASDKDCVSLVRKYQRVWKSALAAEMASVKLPAHAMASREEEEQDGREYDIDKQ